MAGADDFTVHLVTPKIWVQQHRAKSRRAALSQRRVLFTSKQQDSQRSKDVLIRSLLDSQLLPREPPTDGSHLDPFHSMPLSTTPAVAKMVQYFLHLWAPQHGRAFAFEGHENPYLTLLWPFALKTDIYFEALVALCRSTFLATQGRNVSEDKHIVIHRSNVMTKLRQRLQDPKQCADDATLLVVATLGTMDYILGEHKTAAAHVNGMRQMIKIRGGFKGSTPWERLVQANVEAYEGLWAFLFAADAEGNESSNDANQTLPNSEPTTYLKHPFPPDVCQILAKVPPGFSDLGLTGVLSLQMIRALLTFTELKVLFLASPLTSKLESQLHPKIQVLLKDLHRLSTSQTTPTERFLIVGLIAYCYLLRHMYFAEPLDGFYENALKVLTDSALKQVPCIREPDRKCYLWTYVVIGAVLENSEHPPSEWKTVMQLLLENYTEAHSWKTLSRELEAFYWDDDLQRVCKAAYAKAISRQDSEPTPSTKQNQSALVIRNVVL